MSRNHNAMEQDYDPVELLDKPALFTNLRLDRATVPEGLCAYDIRLNDDGGRAATVELLVRVNHMGTVLTAEPLDFKGQDHIRLDGRRRILNFAAEHDCTTVADFQQYLSGQRQEQGTELEQAPGIEPAL